MGILDLSGGSDYRNMRCPACAGAVRALCSNGRYYGAAADNGGALRIVRRPS